MINADRVNFAPVSFGSITKKVKVAGNEVEIPDFTTEDGKIARALNRQAKFNINADKDFIPKTIYECDRAIVESDEIEDCAKWVPYVNPKTGRMYTVIKTSDNTDGTKTVRVLDEDGELVKECDIKPKKIIVLDDTRFCSRKQDVLDTCGLEGDELSSHGYLVQLMVKRNNPLADVEVVFAGGAEGAERDIVMQDFKDILDRLNNGEKIDAINMSFGTCLNLEEIFKDIFDEDINTCNKAYMKHFIEYQNVMPNEKLSEEKELLEQIVQKGVRIFACAGNDGKEYYSLHIGVNGIELVGGFGDNGKVSPYSGSLRLTPHFERFNYPLTLKKNGINITGLHGADFPYPEFLKKYEGKKPEGNVMTDEERETLESLEYGKRYDYINKLKASKKDRFLLDEEDKKLTEANNGIPVYTSFDYHIPLHSSFKYLTVDKNGYLVPFVPDMKCGTSFAAPVRAAKVILNDTMQEILNQ